MERDHSIIELYAGDRPDGRPVFEKLVVRRLAGSELELTHSPAFVRGLARGDRIILTTDSYVISERGRNVCVRVYGRGELALVEQLLTRGVTQIGGQRDIRAEQVLVYSIPIDSGFDAIEAVFDGQLANRPDVRWLYGNIYDPDSGEPLDWWVDGDGSSAPQT